MKNLPLLFFIPVLLIAQNADSVVINKNNISFETPKDSVAAQDTTKKKFDVDAVIFSNATDSVTFDVVNKKMFLFGKGDITYKKTNLKSAKIYVDFTKNLLDAYGEIDSADTSKSKLIDTPVLKEEDEVYEGTSLKYNFKTQAGFISMAKNGKEDKRYEGEKVKKVDKRTYFIEDGLYTTCDEDTPHTYFTAEKMKVMQNDKIIARWIFMNVGGVPFPIPLPFGVFPNKSGRRSGIIAPSYGSAGDRGFYFRNGGYFFALSDYMDLTLTGDYYLQGGYGLRSRYRYTKRYDFNGNLNGGISKIISGEQGDPYYSERFSWNLNVYHHQEIDPSATLDANMQFLSSQYLQDNSRNLNDLLQQDIISNATLVKRWDESGNSISMNYSRTQNLESGNISEVLPSVSFNKSIEYPFKSKTSFGKDQKWYELIGYNYSGNFQNNRTKIKNSVTGEFDREIRGGFQHTVRFTASPKIGYFNFSPSVNYRELWYDKRIKKGFEYNNDSSALMLKEKTIKQISFVRTFDFNISTSTKIYGMMQPNILGVQAFRHTLIPSINYNYRPDFSDRKWGYFDSYIDTLGKRIKYDKFDRGIYGGAGSGEQQRVGFSLGNVFEIKTTKDPNDTTSQEQKIQLLNLNASSGYNFAADSLNLSDLNVDFRTQIGQLLSFNGNSTFTFYDVQSSNNGRSVYKINKFLSDAGKGLVRLTNFGFNISTSISGEKITGNKTKIKNESETENDGNFKKKNDYIELFEDEMPDLTIPWNLSVNYNYNLNKSNPNNVIKNSGMGLNLSISLTQAWRLTFRGNYDFSQKKLNAPQVTVYRDLHCWEMNFTWNPIGTYRGFRFEIRMKAPELQDIKVTKTKDIYSGF